MSLQAASLMLDCPAPRDRIILDGMRFYGYHGVNPEEKAQGQPYVVDLSVDLDLRGPGGSDQLEDTLDYGEVYRVVEAVAGQGEHHLVEALGERIAAALVAEFEIEGVTLTIRKSKPLAGALDAAGVRMTRWSDG